MYYTLHTQQGLQILIININEVTTSPTNKDLGSQSHNIWTMSLLK